MIDVLFLPGTGEKPSPTGQVTGLLKAVADDLDPNLFECQQLDYPASYGPFPSPNGIDFELSVSQGVKNLIDFTDVAGNPVGLVGYSQGATVVSKFLELVANGTVTPKVDLAFALLVANPNRAPDESLDPECDGFGIAGEHGIWPEDLPFWEVANPLDPIACLDAGSKLRGFYTLTKRFSFTDPKRWKEDLVATALAEKRRRWWEIPGHGLWSKALTDALNYGVFGQHTMYDKRTHLFPGTDHTYCAEGAAAVNEHFR